jgi:hypothetical protein
MFFCDLIVTIVLINFRDEIIQWIVENNHLQLDTLDHVNKIVGRNIQTVNDLLLLIVMLFV